MNKLLLTIIALLLINFTYSQIGSINIKEKESTESIIGATVYIESIEKGSISNIDGKVIFNDVPEGIYDVKISFTGFKTIDTIIQFPLTIDYIFYLEESNNELNEFTVSTTRSTRTIEDIPTRMEFIGGEELGEKAIMNSANISMVLRESTGIQMQQTSINSGNSSVRIQGLDGRYTQLLRDGFPLYGGFSGGLSVMQIPPLDLKQFGIIKGSSSTLYGGGAIAGIVNMVSKTPEEEPSLDIMLTQTHTLGSTGNIFYSKRKNKIGYTLYASGNYQMPYDPDKDGFSNLPLTQSASFNPKLFYYPSDKTTLWVGINGTYDKRLGGDVEVIKNGINGLNQFSELNISKRASTQAVYETKFSDSKKLEVKNSISYFEREQKIPNFIFKGSQINSFTEVNYQLNNEKSEWIFGANLYTINFDETADSLERDINEITQGVFVNNIFDVSKKVVLETGMRLDYSEKWGLFPLPKLSILYKPTNKFTTRLGGGLGYKTPDIFTEEAEQINYRNILPINNDNLNAENSLGGNIDFNYKTSLTDNIFFSINQLFYLTSINNGLLLNNTTNGYLQFENSNGNILSKGAETNIKFTYKDFRWVINYAFIEATLNYLPNNPQKPLTPKHNIGSVLMYESEQWRVGYEAYYIGEQTLSNGTKTNDFVTMGLMVVRNFEWGSVFTNFENFTDVRQSKFTPEVLGTISNPIFPEIYAPTDGIVISLGIIIKPFGGEHHD
jgi:iron complex outermembrane receptor protein